MATSNASTRIGNFHNSVGIKGQWEYGTTADSDIEVGLQYSGEGWSVSGTTHIGNSLSGGQSHFTTSNYHQYIRTNFYYEKRQWLTDGIHCPGTGYIYTVRTYKWTGSAQDDGNTFRDCYEVPYSNYQDDEPANSHIWVVTSRASRISYVIAVFGVHLGGTSGYSTHLRFDWWVGSERRLFCGYRDWPMSTNPGPGVIYTNYAL